MFAAYLALGSNMPMINTSEYIFHYCGADALLAIVTKRELWASDIRYLNDCYEGELLSKRLHEVASSPTIFFGANHTFPERYIDALIQSLSLGALHKVACFSQHAKSLPMFRMYTPSAGGYAIGFPREYLSKVGHLHDCVYSADELLTWCCQYVRDFCEAAERLNADLSPQDLSLAIGRDTDLIARRISASVRFKSADFMNESEVRLQPLITENHYRTSSEGHAVIPYTPVSLPNEAVAVMLIPGPNRHPQLATDSLGAIPRAALAAGTMWQFELAYWQEHAYRA